MTRITSPIFRGGSRKTASGRLVRNLVRRWFAFLEQQMRSTGKTFGVHRQRLTDGTVLFLTVNFTGPVPVRRSFVANPGEELGEELVEVIGDGDFYLYCVGEVGRKELISYFDSETSTYKSKAVNGYKSGNRYWDDGQDTLSWWDKLLGSREYPLTFSTDPINYNTPAYISAYSTSGMQESLTGDAVFYNGIKIAIPTDYFGIVGACLNKEINKILAIVTKNTDSGEDYSYYYLIGTPIPQTIEDLSELSWEELAGPSPQAHLMQVWDFNSTGTKAVAIVATEKKYYAPNNSYYLKGRALAELNFSGLIPSFSVSDDLSSTTREVLADEYNKESISYPPGHRSLLIQADIWTYYKEKQNILSLAKVYGELDTSYSESGTLHVKTTQTVPFLAGFSKNNSLKVLYISGSAETIFSGTDNRTAVEGDIAGNPTIINPWCGDCESACHLNMVNDWTVTDYVPVTRNEVLSSTSTFRYKVDLLDGEVIIKNLATIESSSTTSIEANWVENHVSELSLTTGVGRPDCYTLDLELPNPRVDGRPRTQADWEPYIVTLTPLTKVGPVTQVVNVSFRDDSITYLTLDSPQGTTLDNSFLIQRPFLYGSSVVYLENVGVDQDITEFGDILLREFSIPKFSVTGEIGTSTIQKLHNMWRTETGVSSTLTEYEIWRSPVSYGYSLAYLSDGYRYRGFPVTKGTSNANIALPYHFNADVSTYQPGELAPALVFLSPGKVEIASDLGEIGTEGCWFDYPAAYNLVVPISNYAKFLELSGLV